MTAEQFFRELPMGGVMLLLFLAMALAREFGAWARRRAGRAEGESGTAEGHILSAVLGLLALLVAFSFGMALNRYEARRELVVTEANALGSAYLRTAILDDAGRLRGLLLQYAQARLTFGLTSGDAQDAAARETARLQPSIWAEAIRLTTPSRQTPLAGFVLSPLNEAFDTATARTAALQARMPVLVLTTLAAYFIAAAAILGYASAWTAPRHRIASLGLFALFALALGMILDLDRPREGLIPVPQGAMAEAVELMRTPLASPPAPAK